MVTQPRRRALGVPLPVVTSPAIPLPEIEAIWRALAGVPDPEIPAISIVDLGIVREIAWLPGDEGALVVGVTPTYSGCPATDVIMDAIRDALRTLGVPRVQLEMRLSPPWTTNWITDAGREQLRAYGIAPPDGTTSSPVTARRIDVAGVSPLRRAGRAVACPRCASTATVLVSQFGSTACKSHWRCTECLEPFDHFKPH